MGKFRTEHETLYPWETLYKDMTKEGIKRSFVSSLYHDLAKDRYTTTYYDAYLALASAVRDRIVERWITTQQRYHKQNLKRVYYLSLEFLIGRLLGNNIINLGLWKESKEALEELGFHLEDLRNQEVDAGLGNGGLGRLAACFLDSMATMGIPAHGYGIRYDYGIFNQKITNGYQLEAPEEWLKLGNPWEFQRPEYAVTVRFFGESRMYRNAHGHLKFVWDNTQDIVAMPFDIPITGYKNGVVNTLRLWAARSTEEFDLEYFNHGDYEKAVYNKMYSENISKVLYPNDANSTGRELRLKQEYFFTAASVADIIRRFKADNADLKQLPEKVAIQLNDTHPALAVAEFMRVLVDREELPWEEAWDITMRVFAYTNHTVLPEALETWAVPLFEHLLPRHMQIIYEINSRFLREIANRFPGDIERLKRMSIIEEGDPKRIRMAYLAIVGSHSVNGVSALHSELLKSKLFRDFFDLFPEKFNNKTNGITQRRWLLKSNRSLSELITHRIGDRWAWDLYELKKLLPFAEDPEFRREWRQVKEHNKKNLIGYLHTHMGVLANAHSMFDVQVKRIHEYKRQVLFLFYIIAQYLKIKEQPGEFKVPRTFLLGGKAAPGYLMAKLIIKLATSVAAVVNHDRGIEDRMKVLFLENYRVSLAERIFPASELSEQISTAGYEASGTGCMKFMLNGALTVGTLDGANIEMAEEAGMDNLFIFGLNAKEVENLKHQGYRPQDYIRRSPVLTEIFRLFRNNFFTPTEPGVLDPLVQNLFWHDPFLVCADFEACCRVQEKIDTLYLDPEEWTRRSIINTALSGKFSSDRTIGEYAREIWKVPARSS
ncbi:MAG: glycogen/starch/alpha-glucan phosphorylase [Candidatus Omnitrophota bacterium]